MSDDEHRLPPLPTPDAGHAGDDKARRDLGWPELLDHLAARTHTSRGAERARALEPSLDAQWIRSRLAEVSEARALWDRGEAMPFGAVRDVEPHLQRAEKGGHLDGPALREVASTLAAGRALRRHIATRGAQGLTPRLAGRALLITELADVQGAIDDAFDDVGTLLDSASPALGPLRRKAGTLRDELDRRAHSLLDHPAFAPHLQDRFATRREDRFVLPIRADARTRVKGIVHGSSGSGQTVFVEPEEIVDLNNRLKLAELEVADEERRILGELSLLVADAVRPLRVNLEILAELDCLDAAARLAIDLRASEPVLLGNNGPLDLRRARHPLMVLAGRACVPNDLHVAHGGTLVVSGPNAGGKTVALKSCGLLVLMARAGLHLPAQEGSSLPLLHRVLTDVGDEQSIERDLSTFSAHLLHLNQFLAAAEPGVLLLLDEIAVGTDPEQGAALAEAVLEAFADRGATVVVTTHYERLKALAARDPRYTNASVGFDMERLRPTYELHLGVPGASGALVVARRLGLPEAIAARAEALLDGASQRTEELLVAVAEERRRLVEERRAAEEERRAASEERTRAAALAEQAEALRKAARKAAHDEAVEALRQARIELDRVRTQLKHEASQEALEQSTRAVDEAAGEVRAHAPQPEALAGRPPSPAQLAIGAHVMVPRLGSLGVVTTEPRAGKVVVQVGALKLSLETSELRLPPTGASARSGHARSPNQPGSPQAHHAPAGRWLDPRRGLDEPPPREQHAPAVRTPGNTIDLRGERVDAALALAEKFLDDALRGNQEVVYLLHGHGTGALRSALRQHLGAFPRVASLRPGADSEGGDGVTVVELA